MLPLHTRAPGTLHTCLRVEACPGCGWWEAPPHTWALGVPGMEAEAWGRGGLEDQEAPGPGQAWVPDQKSRFGREPTLSPRSSSFLDQSDRKPCPVVERRTQEGLDSGLCREVG